MSNFILQHRKNDSTIYESIDAAKEVIQKLDGEDGEIIVVRYYDNDVIKSATAVCKKTASDTKASWTVFSYEDESIEKRMPNFWKGTLTEYVAIKDKDPDCIYFIVDNNINTTD